MQFTSALGDFQPHSLTIIRHWKMMACDWSARGHVTEILDSHWSIPDIALLAAKVNKLQKYAKCMFYQNKKLTKKLSINSITAYF